MLVSDVPCAISLKFPDHFLLAIASPIVRLDTDSKGRDR
jgi:hypothetical protein